MGIKEFLVWIVKTFPAMFSFLERWVDLKEKELPMKIERHEERKEVREVDAKWDAERRDDKGELRDMKRDNRIDHKKKKALKKKKRRETKKSRKNNR